MADNKKPSGEKFSPRDWDSYFKTILQYSQRPSTENAVSCFFNQPLSKQSSTPVVVDCGCGIGRDSAWLLEQGFTVYAYDHSEQAIETCHKRFSGQKQIHLSCSSFIDYHYPQADIIIANASLFFCPENEFRQSWQKITTALKPGGVIHGDFLGCEDSWVNDDEFSVTAFTEAEVKGLFTGFEIIHFKERNEDGTTAIGTAKHWHSFHILAIKR